MTLIPPSPPAEDPPAPPATPPEGTPPPTETPPAAAGERPDYLPEELWGENGFNAAAYEALRARPEAHQDVPASEDAYALPKVEGFDAEKAASSPLFQALRKNAFANKLGQAAFEQVVTDYLAGETARAEAHEAEQRQLLGSNADVRLKTLGTWLDSSLEADHAATLRNLATDAATIAALEALMNGRAKAAPRTPPPPPAPADTRESIRELMKTPAYRGKESERDPAVIKRVEDFFAAEAARKAGAKQ